MAEEFTLPSLVETESRYPLSSIPPHPHPPHPLPPVSCFESYISEVEVRTIVDELYRVVQETHLEMDQYELVLLR